MKIGDEILIRAKIVGLNASPYGADVKVEIIGYVDPSKEAGLFMKTVKIWINRSDQTKVIVETDDNIVDQSVILNPRQ